MKKIALSLMALSLVLVYSCSKKSSPEKSTVNAESLMKPCYRCHGASLQGNSKTPALAGTKLQKDEIINIVKNGRGKMPAFGGDFSAADLSAVADFIHNYAK